MAGPSGPAFLYNFYPRSPCGERHRSCMLQILFPYFYPRSPCGERHGNYPSGCQRPCISIHALLAESDRITQGDNFQQSHFYPRSPCGERRKPIQTDGLFFLFLSTLSLRRATTLICEVIAVITISIHALLAESDRLWTILYSCPGNFYPRSPCGERP